VPKGDEESDSDDLDGEFHKLGRRFIEILDEVTVESEDETDSEDEENTGHLHKLKRKRVEVKNETDDETNKRRLKRLKATVDLDVPLLKNDKGKSIHRDNVYREFYEKDIPVEDKKKWGGWFRRRHAGQDEVLATAPMRELMSGMREAQKELDRPLTEKQFDFVNQVVDNVSRNRVPTSIVGYSYNDEKTGVSTVMQHPSKGLFGLSTGEANRLHRKHDGFRKQSAKNAMEVALEERGVTFEGVWSRGVLEATIYTVNEMSANFASDNVKPHSRFPQADFAGEESMKSIEGRERLKSVARSLGVRQEIYQEDKNGQPLDDDGKPLTYERMFTRSSEQRGKRDLSPSRKDPRVIRPTTAQKTATTKGQPNSLSKMSKTQS
jgi:hypothetical protein